MFGALRRTFGGRKVGGLLVQAELLPLLQHDFWNYTSLILDPAAKRDLEEACRASGAALPTRLPPGANPKVRGLTSLVETAHRKRGESFVRHAGYFCGANAARAAEANVRSPNDGAQRLAGEFSRACTSLRFAAAAPSAERCVVSVASSRPLGTALLAFAEGFVKGASMRLNEGIAPAIETRTAEGGKVWSATLEWGSGAPAGGPATGGKRTPRR